jgi:hypothetical protein
MHCKSVPVVFGCFYLTQKTYKKVNDNYNHNFKYRKKIIMPLVSHGK